MLSGKPGRIFNTQEEGEDVRGHGVWAQSASREARNLQSAAWPSVVLPASSVVENLADIPPPRYAAMARWTDLIARRRQFKRLSWRLNAAERVIEQPDPRLYRHRAACEAIATRRPEKFASVSARACSVDQRTQAKAPYAAAARGHRDQPIAASPPPGRTPHRHRREHGMHACRSGGPVGDVAAR